MAEITGGELSFEFTLDAENLKRQITDSEGKLMGFTDILEKFGQKADDVFSALGQNAKNQDVFLKNLETQFASITKVIESLRDTAKGPILAEGLEVDKTKLQEIEPYLKAYEEKYINLKNELISLKTEMSSINELRSQERQEIDELKKKSEEYQSSLEDLRNSMANVVPGELPKAFKEVTLEADKTAIAFESLSNVSFDFGITKENLTIQKQVIAEIKKNIEEIEKRAKGMAPGMAQASVLGELKPLKEELAAEEKALASMADEMKKTAVTATNLSTKFTQAKNNLAELNLANKQGTAEYRAAEAEVQKYGTALSDANARARALTAGTIGSLAQGLSLVTGTMAVGTSLMGAFGGKSEELNQIMVKTQALLAATVTLQEIKNTTVQKGGVISGIMAVQEMARSRATNLATAGTLRATIAQRALNLVANANPYILLATAILTVVGALSLYVVATNEAEAKTKKLIDLNKAIADSVAEPLVAYRNLQGQWNALGNDLKAKEKFIQDNKDEFAKLGVEVSNVSDAENVLRKNSGAFVEAMMLRAKAAALAQMAIENMKKSLLLESEYKRKNIDKDLTVGEIALQTLSDGPGGIASRQRAKADAEEVRKSRQADVDLAAEQLKIQKELEALNSKSGFKTPTKTENTKSNKPNSNKPNPITPEEILPMGSVAEIQKRMAAIDETLSKATNSVNIEALKSKRIAITEELAEAIKRIEIKSLEDRANEQEKYSIAYGVIAEKYGKETAEKMYGSLIKGSGSYLSYLEEERKALEEKQGKGLLTAQEKEDLNFAITKLDEYANIKSKQDDWKTQLQDSLRGVVSLSEQIDIIEKKRAEIFANEGNSIPFLIFNKDADGQIDALVNQQKEMYQSFLNEKEIFEQKKKDIDDKYNSIDSQINGSNNSADEKARLLAESAKARGEEYSSAFINGIASSDMWQKAFGEINQMTNSEIRKNIKYLEDQLKELSKGGTVDPEKIKVVTDQLKTLQGVLNNNPFEKIKDDFKEMMGILNDPSASLEKKLGAIQALFNDLGKGVQVVGDAFGGFDEQTQDTVNSIMEIGNAAFDLGKSIASGDVAGMIQAGLKLIGSIGAALSGDKKKEREIQRHAKEVEALERAYNDLARAINSALGDKFFDASRQGIENLRQQKNAINEMIRQEQSKKKKNRDDDKIAEWRQKLNEIDNSIADIGQSMSDKILNGLNAKGLADELSTALVSAFRTGEDSAEEMGKTVDKILADMVNNALRMKLLEGPMQSVVDKMLSSMGYDSNGNGTFDGLTDQERQDIKNMITTSSQNYANALQEYQDLFGAVGDVNEGMKGDIKGITEKTAGALEAQINAMRIIQADMHNIGKSNQQTFVASLQNLVMIEANTRNLIQIRQDISEMNGKMKKGLAGI